MYVRYTRNYYRTYLEKRNRIKIFMRATYGGGFLPIPTDSYSDVTFSYEDKRHGYQVSH